MKNTFCLLLFLSIAFFYSCKKEEDLSLDDTSVYDNALAENESFKTIQVVNSVADESGVQKLASPGKIQFDLLPDCATVTLDTVNLPYSITIDFGTAPCVCSDWDSKYRQGKIIASWTGAYRDSGTVLTIITEDYFVGATIGDMNQFIFLKTITNEGHNANGNLHYSVNVSDAEIILYTGKTITWNSQRDREWIEGEPTIELTDDAYLITGSANGVDRDGHPFSVNINQALRIQNCPWIVAGVLQLDRSGLPSIFIDYGDGICENDATITINGNSYEVNL